MELKFPLKNIAVNHLLHFLEREKIKDFILTKLDKYPYEENYFEKDIGFYRDTLPDFENELVQIITTTNQSTIDTYFSELIGNLDLLRERINIKYLTLLINEWNEEKLKSFEEQVNLESEIYFKSEDRKRKNLEEYETTDFGGILNFSFDGKGRTVKKINHNFYCIEKQADIIDLLYLEDYCHFLIELGNEFVSIATKYGKPFQEGKIKSKVEQVVFNKPVVFVEGEHDITFICKASELLEEQTILNKIELRQRGGYKNLDKIWGFYKESNWETTPQKKILLYDCDTGKQDEDNVHIHKRIIPSRLEHPITKGIENLFPNEIVERAIAHKKAFVDIKTTHGVTRGVDYKTKSCEVNKDEKKNFCDWICLNASPDDFRGFKVVFEIIKSII